VNSRHLKLHFRLPPGTEAWEEVLRDRIASQVGRGHVDVTLRIGSDVPGGAAPVFRLDEERARAYVDALRDLQVRWGLGGEVDIGLVGRCERLLVEGASDPARTVPEGALREVADAAVAQLVAMRVSEGRRLAADLLGRLDALGAGLSEVEALAPKRLERESERLRRSVRELAADVEVDPDRLAREIAFIADKWDISEELVRARAHLEAFRELIDAPSEEPVGKRLSFLGQELLREVNTIGSKANDAAIARIVVEMKNEVESLREQNENVE